jgi:4-hydroxy-3-polyprenylbenzoate decarboxylase
MAAAQHSPEIARKRRYVVAVTGASGAVYAARLIAYLQTIDVEVHVVASSTAKTVMDLELGHGPEAFHGENTFVHEPGDFTAAIASGSFKIDATVVVPCTMGTLGALAAGISTSLIHRVVDVALKEGRKLIIVPRETPANRIHLRNMLTLADAGAVIMPATPGFYHRPDTIDDLVDGFVGRLLDRMGVSNKLAKRWEGIQR